MQRRAARRVRSGHCGRQKRPLLKGKALNPSANGIGLPAAASGPSRQVGTGHPGFLPSGRLLVRSFLQGPVPALRESPFSPFPGVLFSSDTAPAKGKEGANPLLATHNYLATGRASAPRCSQLVLTRIALYPPSPVPVQPSRRWGAQRPGGGRGRLSFLSFPGKLLPPGVPGAGVCTGLRLISNLKTLLHNAAANATSWILQEDQTSWHGRWPLSVLFCLFNQKVLLRSE